MTRPISVYELRVLVGPDGYYIADEDGEAAEPGCWNTWLAAAARLREIVDDDIEATRQEQLP